MKYGICEIERIKQLVTLVMTRCERCGSELTVEWVENDAHCLIVNFVCIHKHTTKWCSSEQLGDGTYVVNHEMLGAYFTAGGEMQKYREFTQVLDVGTVSEHYLRHSIKDMCDVTLQIADESMLEAIEEENIMWLIEEEYNNDIKIWQQLEAMKGLTVVEHNARRSSPSYKGFAHRTNIINKYLHLVRSRCKPTSQRRKTKL